MLNGSNDLNYYNPTVGKIENIKSEKMHIKLEWLLYFNK